MRPLVRYVDKEQAVIDAVFTVTNTELLAGDAIEIHIQLTGPKGRVYVHQSTVQLENDTGVVRFSIGDPLRWWPATLGEQSLYQMIVTILAGDAAIDTWKTTLGMTSVRKPSRGKGSPLLVNGRTYDIQEIIAVDEADENSVLPVAGDCLLLIRDHFGPDVLYEAADRAGILLVQSVPMSHVSEPPVHVRREVDRLSAHPCLAGWLVGKKGRRADRIANRVHTLDPTRTVFRGLPC